MPTKLKAGIFVVVFIILVWGGLFALIHGTRSLSPSDTAKDIEDLRTNLVTLDANVRILTETLTKYEEELKLCRARPFCQDPVVPEPLDAAHEKRLIEILEKNTVPEHPASDEVDNANH